MARHADIDKVIHQPIRLEIIAALAAAKEIEFRTLRDAVTISDSLLSRQLKILESAGIVLSRKGHVGKRPRTWLSLTGTGRKAFNNYLSMLQKLINLADTIDE